MSKRKSLTGKPATNKPAKKEQHQSLAEEGKDWRTFAQTSSERKAWETKSRESLNSAIAFHQAEQPPASALQALERLASNIGFDAEQFANSGYCVLSEFQLSNTRVVDLLAAAKPLLKEPDNEGRNRAFVQHRGAPQPGVKKLFRLLPESGVHRGDKDFKPVVDFLHALMTPGFIEPRTNAGPYAQHNQFQIAGISTKLEEDWRGHIDQQEGGKKKDPKTIDAVHIQGKGVKKQQNFTMLLGVVLEGRDMATQDDAGNLQVAEGSHLVLAERYRAINAAGEKVLYRWNPAAEHGLPLPKYTSVRVRPGQAFIVHHQALHKTAANTTTNDRTILYFRLTRQGTPGSRHRSTKSLAPLQYLDALLDPWLETPHLAGLVAKQIDSGAR
jgi:hypothetical protein